MASPSRESAVRDRRRHHRQPARASSGRCAGLTPTFVAPSTMLQFDEAPFERQLDGRPDGDRRAAGTGSASCRRASSPATMRRRSRRPHRRRSRCFGRRPSIFKLPNITSTRARARRRSCERRPRDERPQHVEALAAHHEQLETGRRTARRISRTAPRWSAPRSPASKAASSRPSACTNRPSARPAPTASSTTRRSPTNWPRASTRRAGSRRSRMSICGRALRLSPLGSRWQGAATRSSCIRSSAKQSRRPADEHDRGAGRTPRPRDRDQGVAGRVERDRAGKADRHAHAHGDRAGRAPSEAC